MSALRLALSGQIYARWAGGPSRLPPGVDHPGVVGGIQLFQSCSFAHVFVHDPHADLPIFATAERDFNAAVVNHAVVAEVIDRRNKGEVVVHDEEVLKLVVMRESEVDGGI